MRLINSRRFDPSFQRLQPLDLNPAPDHELAHAVGIVLDQ